MVRTTTEKNTAIDYINRDIVNVKTELQTLSKLIRDGNGQPSIMQQVAATNIEMSLLKDELHSLRESIDSYVQNNTNKEVISWQFKAAVYVALISSVTTLIMKVI